MGEKKQKGRGPGPVSIAVGQRARAMRTANGINLNVASKKVGVSWETLRRYEAGENSITVDAMVKIAHALEIAPEALLSGEIDAAASAPPAILELVARIEALPDRQREDVRRLVRDLTDPPADKEKVRKTPVRPLKGKAG